MRFRAFLLFGALLRTTPALLWAHPHFQEPWGKDHDLHTPAAYIEPTPTSIGTQFAHLLIRFHQQVISPVDGPRSHYRPSSSQYMKIAMMRYGFLKGYIMGCDRLLRENNEEWVYRLVLCDDGVFKYDPASCDKYDEESLTQRSW